MAAKSSSTTFTRPSGPRVEAGQRGVVRKGASATGPVVMTEGERFIYGQVTEVLRQFGEVKRMILPLCVRKYSRKELAKKAGCSVSTLFRREKRLQGQIAA